MFFLPTYLTKWETKTHFHSQSESHFVHMRRFDDLEHELANQYRIRINIRLLEIALPSVTSPNEEKASFKDFSSTDHDSPITPRSAKLHIQALYVMLIE